MTYTVPSIVIAIFFIVPALCSVPQHCSTLSKMENRIIDISVSIKHGAQVVAGVVAASGAICASKCCQTAQCHLAVFNKESVSNSGHNCYLVNCGSNLANCKLDYHHSFVSISVAVSDSEANDDGRENYHIHSENSSPTTATTTASLPTVSSSTASSTATTSVTASSSTGSQEPATVATASTEPDERTDSDDPEDSESTRTGGRHHHDSDTEDSSHDKTGSGSHQHVTSDSTSTEANVQETADPDKHTPNVKDGCSNVGCVGTGFIVIGVLGGVVAVVISLVLLIVAKRIINSRRRRKFQNVDYLINGMYS